ncbi:MAG TPA: Hpt domain-containing protein [Anaerolineales bacterium]|nr:Hpt domain-containing protein [Anaerolineales bacterium]HNB36639.1 Hpt domain-containing protein [Anaerolineales bacterium]
MPVIDKNIFDTLKESTGEEFVLELLTAFFDDAPLQFALLKSAIASNDTETFRRAAHTLKSNGATFGALEFAALARELEMMGRDKNLEVGNRLEVLQEAYEQMKIQLDELK